MVTKFTEEERLNDLKYIRKCKIRPISFIIGTFMGGLENLVSNQSTLENCRYAAGFFGVFLPALSYVERVGLGIDKKDALYNSKIMVANYIAGYAAGFGLSEAVKYYLK